jgi:aerobic carbon-monoxide dehydrogenase medium subunit
VKPAPFRYDSAGDVESTGRALADNDGAKIIAGGQSLGPMLNLRLARPQVLLDVSALPELRETRETARGAAIGSAFTHAEIEDGEVEDPTGGWLRAAAANIAHRGVRNRGTLGGSLAHADPAADWVIVMTGLGASVLLAGPGGRREVAMREFITGPFQTALLPGEVLVAVDVPKPGAGAGWGYWKYMRQVGEFAKASATVLIDDEAGPPRVALGALGRQPLVLADAAAGDLVAGRAVARDVVGDALPDMTPEALALHVTAVNRALEMARASIDAAAAPSQEGPA